MHPMPGTPPIAVVGSELSALVAAFRLEQAGQSVAWFPEFEARGSADGPGPEAAPLAAPIPQDAAYLTGLAAELGLSKSVRRAPNPPPTYLLPARPTLRAASAPREPMLDGVGGMLARRRVRRLLRWYSPWTDGHAPELGTRLDDRSVADWARLYLGPRNFERLYAPCLSFGFGLDPAETSRQLLLPWLDPAGRPLLQPVVGAEELRQKLEVALSGARQQSPVRRIEQGGRCVRLASGQACSTRATVLAVPASRVTASTHDLSPAERECLERIRYARQLQLDLWLPETPRVHGISASPIQRRTSANFWISESLPGPLAGIAIRREERAGTPEVRVTLVARSSFAGRSAELRDAELIDALSYAAEAHMPGLRALAGEPRLWRGAETLPAFRVGHFRAVERLHLETQRARDRRLFLCGSYQTAPHLEGKVCAGERAAERCLERSAAG